jgi:hypothetical protein
MSHSDPLVLMVIRHAEKPGEAWPGPGLNEAGAQDDKSLVIRGWARAGAWAALFGVGLGGADYPKPAALYAAKPGDPADPGHGPSRRPADTLAPLAERLKMKPDISLAQGEERKLMDKVLGLSGVVLVCWEHKAIPAGILPLIPVEAGVVLPKAWPPDRFDVVLRFDRPAGGSRFAFRQLCPRLLAGDPDHGI